MIDVSTLLPGPELDAMVALAIGWTRQRRTDAIFHYSDEEALKPENLRYCWTWFDNQGRQRTAPDFSSDLVGNAEAERWLYSVPGLLVVEIRISKDRNVAIQALWPTPTYMGPCVAKLSETNGDPVRARMLVICRFVMMVAEGIKAREGKA